MESKYLLAEVENLFREDDDMRNVQDIKNMATEIGTQCANHVMGAKQLIKGKFLHRACMPFKSDLTSSSTFEKDMNPSSDIHID